LVQVGGRISENGFHVIPSNAGSLGRSRDALMTSP
jgi:hypothetical protein